MPRIRTGETATQVVLEDGSTHEIKCIKAEEGELENPLYGDGDVLFFEFEVLDVLDKSGRPIVLKELANDRWNEYTKAWAWARGFGLPIDVGVEIDLDSFVGRTALAKIENRTNGRTERSHIGEVFQLPKSRGK
jgi:hypothetical protein